MAHYRIYLLDDHGRIFVGYDADCAHDAQALARAAAMLAEAGHITDQTEVWSGARCVGSIAAPAKRLGPSLGTPFDYNRHIVRL
jgi:hypothetical protein